MSNGQNGKGDRARPVDKETYDNNYEAIKWNTPANDVEERKSQEPFDTVSK